jgi:lipopolysaccharide export system protein LptC
VIRLLAIVIDRFVLALPLVMVAVLALGSYWMVRSAPGVETGELPRPPDDTPDYLIEGFTVQKFDANGRLNALLKGASAQRLPDAPWIEIAQFTFISTDAEGRVKRASADQGLSSQDNNEFQLSGHALMVREADPAGDYPRLEIRGDFLHVWTEPEKVESDKPVQLVHGKHRIRADSLQYDGTTRTLQMDGRVQAILVNENRENSTP